MTADYILMAILAILIIVVCAAAPMHGFILMVLFAFICVVACTVLWQNYALGKEAARDLGNEATDDTVRRFSDYLEEMDVYFMPNFKNSILCKTKLLMDNENVSDNMKNVLKKTLLKKNVYVDF